MADTIGKISTLKGELRAATEQAQSLANTFKQLDDAGLITSKEEFKKLQNQVDEAKSKVAGLRDQIKDTNEQINVLTGGSKFEILGNSIKDVVGKIASMDFEGASESATRLLKISKNINFVDAIKGIKDIGLTFVKLGATLLTNPLFLIAAAIGAAVYAMGDLTKLIDGVAAKDEERLATLQKQAAASKEEFDAISRQEESLKAQGFSQEEILQKKIDAARVAAADAKAQITVQKQIRDEQVAAAERNKKILSGIIYAISTPFRILLSGVDLLTEKLNSLGYISDEIYSTVGNLSEKFVDKTASLLFDPEETKEKGDETVKQTIKTAEELQATLDALENKQKENRKKDAKDAEDKQKAIDDKKLADGMAAREAYAKANMDAQENELYELQKAQEKQLADFTGTEEERQLLIEAYAIKEQEIYDKYDQIAADADQKAKDEQAARDKKAADDAAQTAKELKDKQDADDAKALQDKQELEDAKFQIASNVTQSAIALSDALVSSGLVNAKKGFQISKAFGIADATISTIQGVVNALGAKTTIPDPFGTALKISNAVAIGAAGAANIAKIASTKFNAGSPSSGGGNSATLPSSSGFGSSSAASAATPAFNLFGQGNQLNNVGSPQTVNGQAQPLAVNVSISETEITQTQNFVRRVSESAVL